MSTASPSGAARYPLWLGVASFAWALVGWSLALFAPNLAVWPFDGVIRVALPAVTGVLIYLNLWFAVRSLRAGVRASHLLAVTALQIGLFTVLFSQIAAHAGPEHYKLTTPVGAGHWIQFTLAQAVKASDVVDVIEAYGADIQVVKHRGWLVSSLLVLYHLVVNVFFLRLLWAGVELATRKKMRDEEKARQVWEVYWATFVVFVVIWLTSALWLRPWRAIDIPLWLLENILRVIDFADVMDSFDLRLNQVPKELWESTLTFACRVLIMVGIALRVSQRKSAEDGTADAEGAEVAGEEVLELPEEYDETREGTADVCPKEGSTARRVVRAGAVVLTLFAAFVATDHATRGQRARQVGRLVEEAKGPDDARAGRALAALRRVGPNAEAAVEPLSGLLDQEEPDRRAATIHTLSYLGPSALPHLARAAEGFDEPIALVAVAALDGIGVAAAPALVHVWKLAPRDSVRHVADKTLRDQGLDAMPKLIAALSPENSADVHHWFQELDRNWTLRRSPNPTFRAVVGWTRRTPEVWDWFELAVDVGTLAVPDLTAAVRNADVGVRVGAAEALGRIGQPAKDAVPALIVALRDTDARVRSNAATALGQIGPAAKAAVPDLAAALRDAVLGVRTSAAVALGQIGPSAAPAIPELVAALRDAGVRASAADALVKIGPASARVLAGLLRESDAGVRRAAEDALRKLGSKAVPVLTGQLRNQDAALRSAAGEALGVLAGAANDAVPALVSALADSDAGVRSASADSLAKIGAGSVPGLVAALGSGDPVLRASAAAVLGAIGPVAKDAGPALISILADIDAGVGAAAADALAKVGPPVVPDVVAALRHADGHARRGAATALGRIGPPATDAVPGLVFILGDADAGVRAAAATALGRIGPAAKGAVPALVAAQTDADAEVREAVSGAILAISSPAVKTLVADLHNPTARARAAETLVQIGAAAVPGVVAALGDTSEGVRAAAAKVLGRIGAPAKDGVRALVAALADIDRGVSEASADALAKIGAASVPGLVTALSSGTPGVRAAAGRPWGGSARRRRTRRFRWSQP